MRLRKLAQGYVLHRVEYNATDLLKGVKTHMKRILSAVLMLIVLMTALPVSAQETAAQPALPLGSIVRRRRHTLRQPASYQPGQVGTLVNGTDRCSYYSKSPTWYQV